MSLDRIHLLLANAIIGGHVVIDLLKAFAQTVSNALVTFDGVLAFGVRLKGGTPFEMPMQPAATGGF